MSDKPSLPESPDALELVIRERREHLAATVDELTARAKPKEIARRGVLGVTARLRSLTHGEDGAIRIERLGAVAGALVVITGALVVLRRRK